MAAFLSKSAIAAVVERALEEDLGSGDLTAALIDPLAQVKAQVVVKEQATLCGSAWFDEVFRQLDASITVDWHRVDGARLTTDTVICELQGPDGQWWWHYDTRTGKVVEGYPVYSVHQDSMAPMALLDLEDAGGPQHSEAITRGLVVTVPGLEQHRAVRLDDEWRFAHASSSLPLLVVCFGRRRLLAFLRPFETGMWQG